MKTKLEETKGYQLAIAFKPFINPACSQHMEIVEDMAKSINRVIASNEAELHRIFKLIIFFATGEPVTHKGLTYQRGINEDSFYRMIEREEAATI